MNQKSIISVLIFLAFLSIGNAQELIDEVPVRQGKHIEWFRSASTGNAGEVILVWSDTRYGDRDIFAQKIDSSGTSLWTEEGKCVIHASGRQEDPVLVSDDDGGAVITWIDFRQDSTGDVYGQRIDKDGNLLWNEMGVPVCLNSTKQISIRMAEDDFHGAYVCWSDYRNSTDGDLYISHLDSSGFIDSGWQASGVSVCSAGGIQGAQSIDRDGAGGAIVAWYDTRNPSDYNIYAQRFTCDGTAHWDYDGKLICDHTSSQETPKLVFALPVGVIVTWRDFRSDIQGDIYVQKIDTAGTLLWGLSGSALDSTSGAQKGPRITSDNDGGAIIVWEDFRNNPYYPDIYAQRVDSDGTLRWAQGSVPVTAAQMSQLEPRIIPDKNNGAFVIWMDERDGAFPRDDVYGQHIDSSGSVTWDEDGLVICNASLYQFAPLFRSDGGDGVISIWGDARNGSIGIYGQHVALSGDKTWEENGELIFYGIDGDARNPESIVDGDKNLWIFWQDHRNAFMGTYIFLQKMDMEGNLTFESDGKQFTEVPERFQTNLDVKMLDSTFYTAWEDLQNGIKQVYVQKLNTDGDIKWDSVGIAVGETYADQVEPKVALPESGGMVVAWSDLRSYFDYDIYAQSYDESGNPRWQSGGVRITSAYGDDYIKGLFAFGDTLIVFWQGGDWSDQNLYYRLLDANGNLLSDSLSLCDTTGNQTNPVFAVGSEIVATVWEDRRGMDGDLYYQIVESYGSKRFPKQGSLVCNEVNDQSNADISVFEQQGDLWYYIVWQDFRNGTDFDIYIRSWEMDTAGDEMIVSDEQYNQINPRVSFVDYLYPFAGVVYEDYSNEILTSDIIFKTNICIPTRSGVDFYIEVPICTYANKQTNPMVASLGFSETDPELYFLWEDKRSSGKTELTNLYATALDLEFGGSVDNRAVPDKISLLSAYPNPFNPVVNLKTWVQKSGSLNISIYDLRGLLLFKTDVFADHPGYYTYKWNGKSSGGEQLPTGIYFCKVVSESGVYHKTITLLK